MSETESPSTGTGTRYIAPSFSLTLCRDHYGRRYKHRYFLTLYRNIIEKEPGCCVVCSYEKRPGWFPPVWVR